MTRTFVNEEQKKYSPTHNPSHQEDAEALSVAERKHASRVLQDIFDPIIEEVTSALEKNVRYVPPSDLPGRHPFLMDGSALNRNNWAERTGFKLSLLQVNPKLFTSLVRQEDDQPYIMPKTWWISKLIICYGATTIVAVEGEYGSQWAQTLIHAARAMYNDLSELALPPLKKPGDQSYLNRFTFQGRHDNTMLEALPTMVTSAALLTLQKVSGHTDPLELLKTIYDSHLVNHWASGLTFSEQAFMGIQMTRATPVGMIIPKPMPPLHPKRVQFAPYMHRFFQRLHRDDSSKEKRSGYELGMGCPLAHRKPGKEQTPVERFFGLYLKYVEVYAKHAKQEHR